MPRSKPSKPLPDPVPEGKQGTDAHGGLTAPDSGRRAPLGLSLALSHSHAFWRVPIVLCVAAASWAIAASGIGGASAQTESKPAKSDKAPINFNFQIRPLLSDRCFKCHGPDEKGRKGKLRLDTREGLMAPRGNGKDGERHVVVPRSPDKSELYKRIVSTDPDEVMPPPNSKLSLTAQEKDLLRRWIAKGGTFEGHWAFQPVGQGIKPPVVSKQRGHSRVVVVNPIDQFVLDRLAKESSGTNGAPLVQAPEATKEMLLRRLSFDLTGLPPSAQEVDAFLADRRPDAYERLVDRLLASPAYGERRANEWLDLARYADTYGYQADVDRDMSPWRDWVIRAFNENLPYDQFLTWQLAGDLLPSPTRDQVLATAFNRLHRQTNEGGSIDEEFRVEYVSDRVHTVGTALLGLSLECARCHDHKYDPIPQRDYYRLSAFFNNIDESGLYSHFTRATPNPAMLLYGDGVEAKHRDAKKRFQAARDQALEVARGAGERFEAWLRTAAPQQPAVMPPKPVAHFTFDEIKDGTTSDSINSSNRAQLVESPAAVPGHDGKGAALRFSGDNSLVCKGVGAFSRVTPFSIGLWLNPAERQERSVILHRSRAWSDSGSRGYEVVLENGRPTFALIHFWPGNAIKIRARDPLPTNVWTHLLVAYDGSSRAAGLSLYVDGVAAPCEIVRDNLYRDILHRGEWGDADVGNIELTLAGRFRDSGFRNGMIDDLTVFDTCLTPPEVLAVSGMSGAGKQPSSADLKAYFLARVDDASRQAENGWREALREENSIVNDVREIMVMNEMPTRRPTFVLKRGAYDRPGEAVEAGTPDAIFPFNPNLPHNRLGLARWMVDRKNPLTARVAVNRAWRTHFGRGLVGSAEDFGSQGQLPTHPELLDWLSATFMDTGWDLKRLHKMIVMSATYRQTSKASVELAARDPENRLLARGPKHRLQAEQIRDHALAISGLLSPRIGGPSVRPYQPAGLWEELGTGKSYSQDKGEGLYRRSLYTFWRRTAPPPTMLTFDATSREVCTAKRETTATPLQALVLLNDPQFVEAARVLAEKLLRSHPSDPEGLFRSAFRTVTGRQPEPRELGILKQLYDEQLALFRGNQEAARKLLKTGEHPADASLKPDELAATAMLASTLMNLDDFVTER